MHMCIFFNSILTVIMIQIPFKPAYDEHELYSRYSRNTSECAPPLASHADILRGSSRNHSSPSWGEEWLRDEPLRMSAGKATPSSGFQGIRWMHGHACHDTKNQTKTSPLYKSTNSWFCLVAPPRMVYIDLNHRPLKSIIIDRLC